MKESILIVEDDDDIARLLKLELEHEDYITTRASDGRVGLDLALSQRFDLIILDVMLPTLNGIEVLRRLRAAKETPVIILTARDQVVDKVAGLDLGASDYVTKPFDIAELLARIRANLRKSASAPIITFKNLIVDTTSHTVTVGGVEVELTKKEFDLLVYLLENINKVLSRKKIVDAVWGFEFFGNTNLVDVYIRYLRAKLEPFGLDIITTVRGSGYIIRE